MVDWVSQNSEFLQVLLNALMVVIWIVYLQIFLVSFRRQQRTDILINLGAGEGLKARCFVSNLSLEPLYLLDVMVALTTDDGVHEAVVTDRAELRDAQLNRPSEATNQGPLESGGFVDIGSINDLLERASPSLQGVTADNITYVEFTALAQTASSSEIVGARRCYRLRKTEGRIDLAPTQIAATQIRSWWGRRQLRKKMTRRIDAMQQAS
jgi:hypothetical protein